MKRLEFYEKEFVLHCSVTVKCDGSQLEMTKHLNNGMCVYVQGGGGGGGGGGGERAEGGREASSYPTVYDVNPDLDFHVFRPSKDGVLVDGQCLDGFLMSL